MSRPTASEIADGIATYQMADAITKGIQSLFTSNKKKTDEEKEGTWQVDDYSTDEYYKIVFTVTIPK